MVQAVFDHWKKGRGPRSTVKLDAKRKRRIEWALREYPLQDVLDAVVGWKLSEFHVEHGHSDLTLLLRDASYLERFRDWQRAGVWRPIDTNGKKGAAERRASELRRRMEAAWD